MKNESLVIYKDIPVLYREKCEHVNRKGKASSGFGVFTGDVPVASITLDGKIQEVINNRGRAYAARKRQKYRKNKKS